MRNQAEYITKALKGKWYGSYGIAFCPSHHNTDTPALSLKIAPDTGKLLVHCFAGCDGGDILRELNRRGLLESKNYFNNLQHLINSPKPPTKPQNKDTQAYIEKIIAQSQPIKGTIAEHYLRHTRKIPCELLDDLQFHPDLKHYLTGGYYPAMIGIVRDFKNSKAKALHRTYLNASGHKANIQPNRMMLGNMNGGGVRISHSPNNILMVAEGIETALSLKHFYPNTNIVATLSSSGMQNLILPPTKGKLIIGIDNDTAGIKAGGKLTERAVKEGWEVNILTPPENQDWNDVLMNQTVSKEEIL